jgi:hemolysin-activating ACP:hemolysin acyltransferase
LSRFENALFDGLAWPGPIKGKSNMTFWKKSDETHFMAGGGRERAVSDQTPSSGQDHTAEGAATVNGRVSELNHEQLTKMAAASKALTADFGAIVGLLMRSPQHKYYTLADMEWLVVPALVKGQFSLATAQNKANGLTAPVGLMLWASVSEEVDKRLSATSEQPLRLKPQEWKSGDILWVITAVGQEQVVQGMLKKIQDRQWKRRPAKAYARDKDGKPRIITLEAKAA